MKRVRFLRLVTTPVRPHRSSIRVQCFTSKPAALQRFASSSSSSSSPETMSTISGDDGPTAPAPPVINNTAAAEPPAQEEKPLPKLTPFEFRQYNRMAEHMQYFHDNFRATWKVLYGACESQKRPKNMSIRQFISTGQQFCRMSRISLSPPVMSTLLVYLPITL